MRPSTPTTPRSRASLSSCSRATLISTCASATSRRGARRSANFSSSIPATRSARTFSSTCSSDGRPAMTSDPHLSDEIDEAIDWQDEPVECESCPHLELRNAGKCQPLRACVFDRYARRIDRFFDWNPELGSRYVKHPYFEVRACAAKTAELFLLPALLEDPEEAVRWSAARRLPQRYLLKLRQDSHREVRIRVAQRLDPEDLPVMMFDDDY